MNSTILKYTPVDLRWRLSYTDVHTYRAVITQLEPCSQVATKYFLLTVVDRMWSSFNGVTELAPLTFVDLVETGLR